MSKILIFSDIHLHEWEAYSTLDEVGINTRLAGQSNLLRQIITHAKSLDIKRIVFCGDLLHKRGIITPQINFVLSSFVRQLDMSGIEFFGIVGNHDKNRASGDIHGLHLLHHFSSKNLILIALKASLLSCMNKPDYAFRGYTSSKAELEESLRLLARDTVLFLHQGVTGVPMGSGYVIDEVLTPDMVSKFHMTFTGHYHTHNKVADNLYVVGSPNAQNWNDANEKKGWLVYDDQANTVTRYITDICPSFISSDKPETLKEEDVRGNYLRITSHPETYDEYRKKFLDLGALSVEFLPIQTGDSPVFSANPTASLSIENIIEELLRIKKVKDHDILKLGEEIRNNANNLP